MEVAASPSSPHADFADSHSKKRAASSSPPDKQLSKSFADVDGPIHTPRQRPELTSLLDQKIGAGPSRRRPSISGQSFNRHSSMGSVDAVEALPALNTLPTAPLSARAATTQSPVKLPPMALSARRRISVFPDSEHGGEADPITVHTVSSQMVLTIGTPAPAPAPEREPAAAMLPALAPVSPRKLKLRESAPEWWRVPPHVVLAADRFDARQKRRVGRAERFRVAAKQEETERKVDGFNHAVYDLFTNRFTHDEPEAALRPGVEASPRTPVKRRPRPVKKQKPWDLLSSIWGNRARWADSKGERAACAPHPVSLSRDRKARIHGRPAPVRALCELPIVCPPRSLPPHPGPLARTDMYDTDEVKRRRFEVDWQRALDMGMQRLIVRRDDEGEADEGEGEDEDGDGYPDEVREVEGVLRKHHDVLASIFSFYASHRDRAREKDALSIHTMGSNVWLAFVDQFKIADADSRFCTREHLSQLFLSADCKAERGSGVERDDSRKALSVSRVEFLYALVKVAIVKYVDVETLEDVSEACALLMTEHILPNLGPQMSSSSDANAFRAKYCYTESTSRVLARHEKVLRCLFESVCQGGWGLRQRLISLGEWRALLSALEFLGEDLTERDATLCFLFARMCVVDPRTERGVIKEESLPFEGFLEALCRLAILKGLPSASEVEAAGCSDAGIYLARLAARTDGDGDEALAELRTRGTEWGAEPSQPVRECLEHTIAIAIRTIEGVLQEGESAAAAGLDLGLTRITTWCRTIPAFKGSAQ